MNVTTVTNEKDCQLVTSHKPDRDGHIMIGINGKYVRLHRFVYEERYGEIPNELVVRHKCDNPNCINPEHLEIGTHADNIRDRVERNRSARGSNHGRAKLTEDNVRYIRNTNETTYFLAKEFDVDRKTIRNIRQFKTWKHVV